MPQIKPIYFAIALPVLAGAWYAFRPELLFVNKSVNEKLPVNGATSDSKTLGAGAFVSYAHETTGRASLVQVGSDNYIRLSDFKTSNGPDVHVYLVKGNDPSGDGVNKKGFLDLGTIKGNQGDQNYQIPAGTSLADYGSVSIWCKRFSVGFGGAPITKNATAQLERSSQGFTLAGFGGSDIKVTGGNFKGATGSAQIIETSGKRFLTLTKVTSKSKGLHIYLVKSETIENDGTVKSSQKIDLGILKPGGNQKFEISKDIDAWLYRTVSLWDAKKGHSTAVAELRSDQERKAPAQTV